ncbi:hypothetical protein L7F22_000717 [Adiantum nelumboides]|nr:hypothetical protein [Adiantum nelumboides]
MGRKCKLLIWCSPCFADTVKFSWNTLYCCLGAYKFHSDILCLVKVGFPFTRLRGFSYSEEGWSFIIVASHGVRLSEVTTVLRRAENDVLRRTSTYNPQHFMVERDGKLYSWMEPHGLMVYDIGKGVCAHVGGTRSQLLEDRRKTLLKCGQSLVRVCTYYDPDVVGYKMHCKVEKLCDENPLQEPIKWEEMGVMPAHLHDELVDGEWRIGFEFFAGGINHVCFRSRTSFKILTFDLVHRTWNWLPDCLFWLQLLTSLNVVP